jgi:Fur family ferric uptake transcriptional regulator
MSIKFNTTGKRYRKSKVRDRILQILEYKSDLLSVPEILKELEVHGLFPNKSTVYREIETLLREDVIREVDILDGKKHYELFHPGNEFEASIVCTSCHSVAKADLSETIPDLETVLASSSGYQIAERNLVFSGLCKKCRV